MFVEIHSPVPVRPAHRPAENRLHHPQHRWVAACRGDKLGVPAQPAHLAHGLGAEVVERSGDALPVRALRVAGVLAVGAVPSLARVPPRRRVGAVNAGRGRVPEQLDEGAQSLGRDQPPLDQKAAWGRGQRGVRGLSPASDGGQEGHTRARRRRPPRRGSGRSRPRRGDRRQGCAGPGLRPPRWDGDGGVGCQCRSGGSAPASSGRGGPRSPSSAA